MLYKLFQNTASLLANKMHVNITIYAILACILLGNKDTEQQDAQRWQFQSRSKTRSLYGLKAIKVTVIQKLLNSGL